MLIPKFGRHSQILLSGVYVILIIWAIAFLFPFFWMVVSSLKDKIAVYDPSLFIPSPAKVVMVTIEYDNLLKAEPALTRDESKKQIVEEVAVAALRILIKFPKVYRVNISAILDGKEVLSGQFSRFVVERLHTEYFYWRESRIRSNADEILANFDVKYYWEDENKNAKKEELRPASKISPDDLSFEIQRELQLLSFSGKVNVKTSSSVLGMFEAYRMAWTSLGTVPFWRFFVNSLVYTGGTCVSQMTISALAAYGLSRLLSQRASKLLLMFYLATMMLPPMMLFLPLYLMITKFPFATVPFTQIPLPHINLVNTYWGLILPHTAWGFSVFLFMGFFNQLPEELFDAARLDGASEMKIFWRIVTPLSRPAYAIIGLYSVLAVWMTFFWPYLVCKDPKMWPFTVALYYIQLSGRMTENVKMASSVIVTIPTILIFLAFQRFIQKGLAWTGLKG